MNNRELLNVRIQHQIESARQTVQRSRQLLRDSSEILRRTRTLRNAIATNERHDYQFPVEYGLYNRFNSFPQTIDAACERVLVDNKSFIVTITGEPGNGKSTTISHAIKRIQESEKYKDIPIMLITSEDAQRLGQIIAQNKHLSEKYPDYIVDPRHQSGEFDRRDYHNSSRLLDKFIEYAVMHESGLFFVETPFFGMEDRGRSAVENLLKKHAERAGFLVIIPNPVQSVKGALDRVTQTYNRPGGTWKGTVVAKKETSQSLDEARSAGEIYTTTHVPGSDYNKETWWQKSFNRRQAILQLAEKIFTKYRLPSDFIGVFENMRSTQASPDEAIFEKLSFIKKILREGRLEEVLDAALAA